MHQNAGFCIINISSEGHLDHQTPVAGGDTPTTPTPVPRRPILVPLRFFQAGYCPVHGPGMLCRRLSEHLRVAITSRLQYAYALRSVLGETEWLLSPWTYSHILL